MGGEGPTWLERLYCGRLGDGLECGGECGEGGRFCLSSPRLPSSTSLSLLPSPSPSPPCRSSSRHAASLAMLSFTWWTSQHVIQVESSGNKPWPGCRSWESGGLPQEPENAFWGIYIFVSNLKYLDKNRNLYFLGLHVKLLLQLPSPFLLLSEPSQIQIWNKIFSLWKLLIKECLNVNCTSPQLNDYEQCITKDTL